MKANTYTVCVCVCVNVAVLSASCVLRTWRLPSLVVDVQRSALVHTGHHLVVGAVEAVHPDHAGLGLHVGVV